MRYQSKDSQECSKSNHANTKDNNIILLLSTPHLDLCHPHPHLQHQPPHIPSPKLQDTSLREFSLPVNES